MGNHLNVADLLPLRPRLKALHPVENGQKRNAFIFHNYGNKCFAFL